jgi:hypothetical protein
MLDSHPDLAIPNESHFIPQLMGYWASTANPREEPWVAFADRLAADHRFGSWGLDVQQVRRVLSADSPTSYADSVRNIFDLYARERGKPRYGDKTPSYVQCIPLLAGLFPESRFVHIVRDGRDVALSILELGFGAETIEEAALEWMQRVRRGRRAGRHLGSDRYLEVRYESLVGEPEEALFRICEFLGLDFDQAMLRYFDRVDDSLRGLDEKRRRYHRHVHRPPTTGLRDWRRQMVPGQVVAFEAIAGNVLEEFGYETAVPRVSGRQYARARRAELRFHMERVRGRLSKMRSAVLS